MAEADPGSADGNQTDGSGKIGDTAVADRGRDLASATGGHRGCHWVAHPGPSRDCDNVMGSAPKLGPIPWSVYLSQ